MGEWDGFVISNEGILASWNIVNSSLKNIYLFICPRIEEIAVVVLLVIYLFIYLFVLVLKWLLLFY
jgi:hypothetical protein